MDARIKNKTNFCLSQVCRYESPNYKYSETSLFTDNIFHNGQNYDWSRASFYLNQYIENFQSANVHKRLRMRNSLLVQMPQSALTSRQWNVSKPPPRYGLLSNFCWPQIFTLDTQVENYRCTLRFTTSHVCRQKKQRVRDRQTETDREVR